MTNIEESRAKLLASLQATEDFVLVRTMGNKGDELIYAGMRQLLKDCSYRECRLSEVPMARGHLAVVAGGGGWCSAHCLMPDLLLKVEDSFDNVIIFPSSFDTSVESVLEFLSKTRAKVFARELISYNLIKSLCDADLAHDSAFFFDYSPYRRNGQGILDAYRTDKESTEFPRPLDNNDISETCETLDEWLWTIARHEIIRTDRAHVTIAGALLGKKVEWRPNSYHKVAAIVEYALKDYTVRKSDEGVTGAYHAVLSRGEKATTRGQDRMKNYETWQKNTWRMTGEMSMVIASGSPFVFVDDNQVTTELGREFHAIPFLERNGKYWGAPEDDATAIRELERLRSAGAKYIVFAWPAFWWLEHYPEFRSHLKTNFRCIAHTALIAIFDLGT